MPATAPVAIASKDLHIVSFATDNLVPYSKNPRRNDRVVDRMVASIQEYGFKIPILCRSDGNVIDGHLRLKAALQLGLAEVPAILCDDWTDAQVKAFRLLVNRSANWAEWDTELLQIEFRDRRHEVMKRADGRQGRYSGVAAYRASCG